jgi:hypothetical protein
MISMRKLFVILVSTIAAAGLSSASTLGQPSSSQPTDAEAHLHNYGDIDKTCIAWTDHCRSCRRRADGGPLCSNIGISCTPEKVECVQRAESDEKAK